jgi:hypothetical protein
VYLIQRETAEACGAGKTIPATSPPPPLPEKKPETQPEKSEVISPPRAGVSRVTWRGNIPPQKWMNFYTKVLSKFAAQNGLTIGLNVEIAPEGGVSNQKVDEVKVALRELGLSDDVALQ